jgi:hypothetical protein
MKKIGWFCIKEAAASIFGSRCGLSHQLEELLVQLIYDSQHQICLPSSGKASETKKTEEVREIFDFEVMKGQCFDSELC